MLIAPAAARGHRPFGLALEPRTLFPDGRDAVGEGGQAPGAPVQVGVETSGLLAERGTILGRRREFRANGVVIVFDLTNPDSFSHVTRWMQLIRKHCDDDVEVFLVGNKCDQDSRRVRRVDAENWARKNRIHYLEVSAKTGENVSDTFLWLSECCLASQAKRVESERAALLQENETKKLTKAKNRRQEPSCSGANCWI